MWEGSAGTASRPPTRKTRATPRKTPAANGAPQNNDRTEIDYCRARVQVKGFPVKMGASSGGRPSSVTALRGAKEGEKGDRVHYLDASSAPNEVTCGRAFFRGRPRGRRLPDPCSARS